MEDTRNIDSIELSFIGEVMLGRQVGEAYEKQKQQIINIDIKNKIKHSDFIFANLGAPVAGNVKEEDDIMTFRAKP